MPEGLLSSIGLRAQNMVVTLDNATTETFAVASIQEYQVWCQHHDFEGNQRYRYHLGYYGYY